MKLLLFTIISLFSINSVKIANFDRTNSYALHSEKYPKIFGSDYNSAINFMKVNKKYINSALKDSSIDKSIIVSFLFPERIRYSLISDLIETEITESIYVNFGSSTVDFSIGYFQMKPSFIEKMEKYVKNNQKLTQNYNFIYNYNSTNLTEIRKQRVQRLKSFNWQLKYAAVFYSIISHKFDLEDFTKKQKIEFYAAAYNYGFNSSKEEITKTIESEYFPYGGTYPGKQYSYAKIASDFYENYYKLIF